MIFLIFLEKIYTKCSVEVSTLSISLDQQSKMLQSLFLLYLQAKVYQDILKLRCWPLSFINPINLINLVQIFKKKKQKTSGTSLPKFLHDFWRKIFVMIYFINWPNLIAWLLLLLEILGNMCIVIICCPVCNIKKLKLTIAFLSSRFSA